MSRAEPSNPPAIPGRAAAGELPSHFKARLDAFRRRTGRVARTLEESGPIIASPVELPPDVSGLLDELSTPPPDAVATAHPPLITPSPGGTLVVEGTPVDGAVAVVAQTNDLSNDDGVVVDVGPQTAPSAGLLGRVAIREKQDISRADDSHEDADDTAGVLNLSVSIRKPNTKSEQNKSGADEQADTDNGYAQSAEHLLLSLGPEEEPGVVELAITSTTPASLDESWQEGFDPYQDEEPVFLDPGGADIPATPPRAPRAAISPGISALFGAVFGFAAIATLLAMLIQLDPEKRSIAPAVASGAAHPAAAKSSKSAAPTVSAKPVEEEKTEPATPPVWRVAQMADEDGVKIIEGKMGDKSLMDALTDANVPKAQVFRILKSFDDTKRFDRPKKSDSFAVALDKPSKRVRAFEYKVSQTEVYQAKENEEGKLVGGKLDLHIEQHRVSKAIIVKDDLKSAVVEAGLDDDLINELDVALEGRLPLRSLHKGAMLRVVVQEQTVAGKYAKYVDIEAVEYLSPKKDAKPLRFYHYKGKAGGYFDANGKAPYNKGPWRWPVQFPRVTSKFNPKRLHPVLHTVMPHNGTDFGAPMGTPVYAVSAGTITSIGMSGPSGNLVTIDHGGGLVTGYAHLSKFAPNLKVGDKVECHQLIGNVGSTGRSTGPHLHFSLKKNGVFVDALQNLKMDGGERVLPKDERDDFETMKAELDRLLDGISLPDRGDSDAPSTTGGSDDDPDEDNHEDKPSKGEDKSSKDDSSDERKEKPEKSSKPEKGEKAKKPSNDDSSETPSGKPAKPVEEGDLDSAIWKP